MIADAVVLLRHCPDCDSLEFHRLISSAYMRCAMCDASVSHPNLPDRHYPPPTMDDAVAAAVDALGEIAWERVERKRMVGTAVATGQLVEVVGIPVAWWLSTAFAVLD